MEKQESNEVTPPPHLFLQEQIFEAVEHFLKEGLAKLIDYKSDAYHDRFISPKTLAFRWDMNIHTINAWDKKGLLPRMHFGKNTYRYRLSDIIAMEKSKFQGWADRQEDPPQVRVVMVPPRLSPEEQMLNMFMGVKDEEGSRPHLKRVRPS